MTDRPYPLIVAGTDGSQTAAEAVLKAGVLAGALDVPLLIASAFRRTRPEELGPPSERAKMPGEGWMSVNYQHAKDLAHEAEEAVRRALPDLEVHTAAPEGEASEALLECVEGHPGALLVVGSQGMTGSRRFLLGSVPNKVTHHPVGDVLIARTGAGQSSRLPERMLVGTDGSKTAARAVWRAATLAAETGATLTVCSADSDRGRAERVLDDTERQLARVEVPLQRLVSLHDPATALVEAGADHDLVVVGNRGMTGASRFLLGSVPNKVSHHITVDLLIVKTDTG